MTQPSGVFVSENTPGTGQFQLPGQGQLFFFDVTERGPDLATDLSLDDFTRIYGSEGLRSSQLLQLYGMQRSPLTETTNLPPVTISRVRSATAVKATLTLQDRNGSPVPTLRLDAQGVGISGNALRVDITDGQAPNTFTILIRIGAGGVGREERYANLTMNIQDLDRYAVSFINARSRLVRATALKASVYAATDNPVVVANAAFTAGTDGAVLVASDYTDALARFANIDREGILYTPSPSAALATAMLALGGGKYALIDTPVGNAFTANATFRSGFDSSFGELVNGYGFTTVNPNVALPLAITKAAMQLMLDAERGPHYIASNRPVVGVTGFEDAYRDDALSRADQYDVAGITLYRPNLPGGGIGPFGARTASWGYFSQVARRRVFSYVGRQIRRIASPLIQREPVNTDLVNAVNNGIIGFMARVVQGRGMVVGPNGSAPTQDTAWNWSTAGTTQQDFDDGNLRGRLGMRVASTLMRLDVELTEFKNVQPTETVAGQAVV